MVTETVVDMSRSVHAVDQIVTAERGVVVIIFISVLLSQFLEQVESQVRLQDWATWPVA